MSEYITILKKAEWVNGRGWSHLTAEERDDPKFNINWVDELNLSAKSEDELRKMANANEGDILWTFKTYDAADYEKNGENAEELYSAEKRQSEVAAEWLDAAGINTLDVINIADGKRITGVKYGATMDDVIAAVSSCLSLDNNIDLPAVAVVGNTVRQQLAIKPEKVQDDYHCPVCHYMLQDNPAFPGVHNSYCGVCGQKIDWKL